MDGNPLRRLRDFGQSVWCDEIGREFLTSGVLQTLIQRDGVCGVTSNPTIFYRSITTGSAYEIDIARLVAAGLSAEEMLETLMVADIELAAEQLGDVYEETGHGDGWVSLEVAPGLAYDTVGTVAEVKRVRSLVSRPNVMIKVPGTQEGVAAVRELVSQGYCVNVTLIFSVERYAEVIEAYLSGLEALVKQRQAGKPLPPLSAVHGVASFFVSRIDTAVDRRLDELGTRVTELPADASSQGSGSTKNTAMVKVTKGLTAIASAKGAYQLFRSRFAGSRWEALAKQGANMQRPLWASTSTKNPQYSDILYVQELIGPHTVNTMPLVTMEAYRDHGHPEETITKEVDAALAHLEALSRLGIDMREVAMELEREGVQAFVASFEALRSALDEKREEYDGRGTR